MTVRAGTAAIERASPDDLMLLACDVGPVPLQVGAVLVAGSEPGFDAGAVEAAIAGRIAAIPRLRQRLCRVPLGCGRPVWVDDPGFDLGAHIRSVSCPAPGDEQALLELAASVLTEPLPWSRPHWSATVVSGLSESRTALVLVFHHVLADGIGGLAVLASLADAPRDAAPGPAPPPATPFPRPVPSARQLAIETLGARYAALAGSAAAIRRPGSKLAQLRSAAAEIRPSASVLAPRTTLNRPVGSRRRLSVVRADLGQIRAVASAHRATVNDVALTAAARALRAVLAGRGERLDEVVASVIVSGRAATAADVLGNRVGVMPVRIPAGGDRFAQLERIAEITAVHKTARRGASAGLLRPAFRTLAALGVLPWAISHQRLVNVFLTNLRGPERRLRFAGAEITDVLPLTLISGNVTTSFAVISYSGVLSVVTTADPDWHGDLDVLTAELGSELTGLSLGSPAPQPASG